MSTGRRYSITVPDPAQAAADWTHIYVYRSAARNGPWGADQFVGPLLLSSATHAYEYVDAAGQPWQWYRHRFYHSTTRQFGPWSEPVPGGSALGVTMRELRRRAAGEVRLYLRSHQGSRADGPSGTTSAAGSSTTVVCAAFADPVRQYGYQGCYLLFTSGALTGQQRSVQSFDAATGTFTLSVALPSASPKDAEFELYREMLAPDEWTDALTEQLQDTWHLTRHTLVGIAGRREYPLPPWIERSDQVVRLEQLTGTDRAHTWLVVPELELRDEGVGGVSLIADLEQDGVYELTAYRQGYQPLSLDEWMPLAGQYQRIVVIGTAAKAARALAQESGILRQDRAFWVERAAALEAERQALTRELGLWDQSRPVRRGRMVSMGQGTRLPAFARRPGLT